MSDDNADIDRRKVMKTIGGSLGIGAVGLAQSTAASQSADVDRAEISRIESSEKVQRLLDDVGGVALPVGRATQTVLGEESHVTVTELENKYGEVVYIEPSDNEPEAMFFLSEEGPRPQKYSDIPDETSPTLFATDSGTALRRHATDAEHAELASIVDERQEDTTAFTGSDVDGFYVDVRASDSVQCLGENEEQTLRYHVQPDHASTATAANDIQTASVSTSWTPSLPSIPDEAVEECAADCTSCISSIGGCSRCALVCAGSPTGIGAVKCAVCIKIACSLGGGVSCAACSGCLLSNVPGCC